MRIPNFVILSLLLLTTARVQGQSQPDTVVIRTVLFKVTRVGSDKTSYLFGTHHAFGNAFFDTLALANKALAACDYLIKENLDIPGEQAQDIINRRTAKTAWKKYLSPDDLAYIDNLFAQSPTDYRKMTPAELTVFLQRYYRQHYCLKKSSTDSSLTLDNYIASRASALGLTLVGLETTEEQIALINEDVAGMPRKVHKRRLASVIAKNRAGQATDCEETHWYTAMEIHYQLHEPCTRKLVLTDRNNKWMIPISELLEQHACFIAVGLSHLMYDCGLISQLTAMGYEVTPVALN